MRRESNKTYLCLFFTLLALLSLPKSTTEHLRGTTISLFAPFWQQLSSFKTMLANFSWHVNTQEASIDQEELQQLRLENILLQAEIKKLKESMEYELRLINLLAASMNNKETHETAAFLKKRHRVELQKLLQLQLQAIPAHVIFRSPASWNSSLWINVGSSTNDSLSTTAIAKNSPVIIGTSIIGVIDYVGHNQSRVRLITDSGLTPSVRAFRSDIQRPLINEKIHVLLQMLENNRNFLTNVQDEEELILQLKKTAKQFSTDNTSLYLAKGETHGASKPLWRSQRHLLHGVGFNYDFSDGEGPARDLRSGAPIATSSNEQHLPILKVGDLLVTTGMDGVFPPDLLVGEISHVYPLKEGDYYYELDALPTAGNFDDISLVFVIPPVGYDPDEHPLPAGWDHDTL